MTIVFCDLVDSTPLSEGLDPEALRHVISRYHDEARKALERHGGTVEKFIGDAVVAVFGIPVVHEDDPLRAIRACVEMRGAIASLNEELERTRGVRIGVRTGVNTGEVVAGDPSSGQGFVTGDPVVVAQRLEGAAGVGEILLGEMTARLVAGAVVAEPIGSLELKGKAQPVPAWRLGDDEPGTQPAPRLDSPLVGRSHELDQLLTLYEETVVKGSCRIVTVLGEPGVGKSRLARELAASLAGQVLVVEGRCLPYGRGITYWPLVEIVRGLAGLASLEPPERVREAIVDLLPGGPDSHLVGERVSAALGVESTGPRAEEIHWGIRRLFETLAHERPLLVLLDDIQWAEETFLDLIEYLAGWGRGPILVCCLARPDLLEEHPSWGVGGDFETLVLRPLEVGDVPRLIDAVAGSGTVDPAIVARISRVTGGNPLFVEEMVRMLYDQGVLAERNGSATAPPSETLGVPGSVQLVLAARLDRLATDERIALQRASVIGEVFGWGAVAELTPSAERDSLRAHLHALVRKDLIKPDPHPFLGEDAFAFGHILVRDAAYESMPKGARAELHERFADWADARVARGPGEYDEIIGYHLEQAHGYRLGLGTPDEHAAALAVRAGERLGAAGLKAFARGDMPAAAGLLRRASDLLPKPAAAALAPELGRALQHVGDLETAESELLAAFETAYALHDPLLDIRLRIALAHVRIPSGRSSPSENERVAKAALNELHELGAETGFAQAERLLAFAYADQGRFGEMRAALTRALRSAEAVGDARERQSCLSMLGYCLYFGPTPVDQAMRSCEAMLAGAEGDRLLEGGLTAFLAGLNAMAGSFEKARALCRASRSAFEELGVLQGLASQRTYAATVELLAGDPFAAERELRGPSDATLNLPSSHYDAVLIAEILYRQGRFGEASRYAKSLRGALADDLFTETARCLLTARLQARSGSQTASELALEALRLTENTDALNLRAEALLGAAETHSLVGDDGEAERLGREALDHYRLKGNVAALRKAEADLRGRFPITPKAR